MPLSYHSMDISNKLIWNLRDMGHTIRYMSEGRGSQKRILIILNKVGMITQSDLTEHLGIQSGSASEVIGKLENAGLLIRTSNPADHRTTILQLSECGKIQAIEAEKQHNQQHQEMFSVLSETEQETLLALLEKVQSNWAQRYHKNHKRKHQRSK
ncbi:MAG: MarR family transcriptional regulator [Bacillales bacterium]|nr:MarR family transcriptional regulator [Bacillales bacterium]